MRYPFEASPHFRQQARRKVTAIILHYSGGLSLTAAVRHMQRTDARTSVHYVIGREGRVVQMVLDENVAFHAGRSAMDPEVGREVNVNEFSLGVMLVGDADSGFTDRQMTACYALVEQLVERYAVPPDRIRGHEHISPGRQLDPGGYTAQFDWRRLHEVATRVYATLAPTP